MTKEYLIEKLKLLQQSGDTEMAHGMADDFLLEYINDEDIKREFEEVPRWYA